MMALAFMLQVPCSMLHAQNSDGERLGMAIDYFQSGKYHEALLLFARLDRQYQLNPRFRAYMGVCYYYDEDYPKATEYLDSVIPKMEVFAPHERSVYYFIDAESHFLQQHYAQAVPHYEQALTVCYDRERGDIHYRLGFCWLFLNEKGNAFDNFNAAQACYERFGVPQQSRSRLPQTRNMAAQLKAELAAEGNYTIQEDSIP